MWTSSLSGWPRHLSTVCSRGSGRRLPCDCREQRSRPRGRSRPCCSHNISRTAMVPVVVSIGSVSRTGRVSGCRAWRASTKSLNSPPISDGNMPRWSILQILTEVPARPDFLFLPNSATIQPDVKECLDVNLPKWSDFSGSAAKICQRHLPGLKHSRFPNCTCQILEQVQSRNPAALGTLSGAILLMRGCWMFV